MKKKKKGEKKERRGEERRGKDRACFTMGVPYGRALLLSRSKYVDRLSRSFLARRFNTPCVTHSGRLSVPTSSFSSSVPRADSAAVLFFILVFRAGQSRPPLGDRRDILKEKKKKKEKRRDGKEKREKRKRWKGRREEIGRERERERVRREKKVAATRFAKPRTNRERERERSEVWLCIGRQICVDD